MNLLIRRDFLISAVATALLLAAAGPAQAASRCGSASAPAGAGTLELSLWQEGDAAPSEHAGLTIDARSKHYAMVLHYRPAGGETGAPIHVEAYVYAPWRQQVSHGDILRIAAGAARWQGASPITGIHSRSGRAGVPALYPVAGGMAASDPALIAALAAGGEVALVREAGDGSRLEDVVDLPKPEALRTAYRAARAKALAGLATCPPPSVSMVSAP